MDNGTPKKIIKVLVQLGDFLNFDIYQRGLYHLQCRLYARSPSHKHPVRIDGNVIEILSDEESRNSHDDHIPRVFPHQSCQRLKCHQDHRLCSWRCKVTSLTSSSNLNISEDPAPDKDENLYSSETFLVQNNGGRIPLYTAVVFHLEVDDVPDFKGEPAALQDYQDGFLEFSLCFTKDESSKVKEEILPVQTRCLRLKNLFPSATVTRPVIYQFHSVKFDGVFFSSLDIIVSFSNIGYSLPKRRPTEVQTVPQTPTNAPPTANKSFWSWMVKKLSWNFSNKESVYTTITTRKETYGIKDFPIEMLRIENTIDHLIQLQSMLNQVVYEFKLTYTDQCMTEGYIYEFVHAALFGQENTSFTQQRGIGVELKQDIYTQITAMVKTFLKTCYHNDTAITGLDAVAHALSDLTTKVWRAFLFDMGVLSYDRLTSLRVIWSRVKNAKLCEYILNRQDLETPMPKLLARLQKIMTVHFPYDAILDDESAESPVLLEHHTGPEPPVAQSGLNSRKMSRFDVLKSSMLGMTPQINSREGSALLIRDSSRTSASCMATDMESMRAIYSKSTFDDQSSVLSYLPNPYLQGIEIGLERSHRREPKSHLVVFVHGLLGSSFDFRQYRNRLSKQHLHMGIDRSDHMYLISRSNEDDTLIDMTKQGNNLGKEISAFIQEQGLIIDKISFVCHSMGGIIARVAITTKYLEVYKDHFYEFVTYGTPHVSLIYHTHTLINSFLGIYQTIQKSKCINQLHLRDSPDPRKTFLFRLSQDKTLASFQHIRFFGSKQDRYVPFASTLMEEDVTKGQSTGSPSKGLSIMNYKQSLPSIPASSSGGISGSSKVAPKSLDSVYTEMLVSLNKTIEGGGCRVERFEIAFPDSSPSSRDLLGRKGHVAMVEDPHVLELLLVANRLHL